MIYFLPLATHTNAMLMLQFSVPRVFPSFSEKRKFSSSFLLSLFPVLCTTSSKSKLKDRRKFSPQNVSSRGARRRSGIFLCLHTQTVLFRQKIFANAEVWARKILSFMTSKITFQAHTASPAIEARQHQHL